MHFLGSRAILGMGRLCSVLFVALAPAAAQVDYKLDVISPGSVYAGHNLYFDLMPMYLLGSPSHLYFNSIKLGTTAMQYTIICRIAPCTTDSLGRFYEWNGDENVTVQLAVPSTTPAGQYSLNIVTEVSGVTRTTSISLRVLALPGLLPTPVLTNAPIPNLAKWESTMVQLGSRWWPNEPMSFGTESQVWYYDGARVYFQLADYTKDRSWETAALTLARQYRDFVVSVNGAVPGWRVFTRGLRMAWERTGDPSFHNALVLLSRNAPSASTLNGGISDETIREVSYLAAAYMDAERAGEPRHPMLARAIDHLLGDFDMLFVTGNFRIHQTFYDGLAAEVLIDYYQLTKDPRIPATIKTMLDWMWDYGWDKGRYNLVYNPEPEGPRCSSGCQSYSTDLVNMVAPTFAWYWSVTGNSLYLQRGDEFFAHALDSDISYSGKIFSQNFRWSNMYVTWRNAVGSIPPPCTYSVTPTSLSVPSSGGLMSLQVTASSSACTWTATSNSWAAAVTTLGSGSTAATYSVAGNTSSSARSVGVTVAGVPVNFNQAGRACTFSVTPTFYLAPSAGGALNVQLTTSASDCRWTASGNEWIKLTSPENGTGAATVSFAVSANSSTTERSASVSIAGTAVVVTEQGIAAACTYSVTPTDVTFPASASHVNVWVRPSQSSCQWTAAVNVGWATLSSTSDVGSKRLKLSVTANQIRAERFGTLNVSGVLVPFRQQAQGRSQGAGVFSTLP